MYLYAFCYIYMDTIRVKKKILYTQELEMLGIMSHLLCVLKTNLKQHRASSSNQRITSLAPEHVF